jgi:FKBP-type peptidyl-prolyl cis-trans isomerase
MTSTQWVAQPSFAAVTDETDNFANNWWTKDGNGSSTTTPSSNNKPSDEVTIFFAKKDLGATGTGLGIELSDIEFRTNRRVYVKSIRPGSLAERLGIQTDWIVVSINEQSTERTNAQGVSMMLKSVLSSDKDDKITFVFRDPFRFREQLDNLSTEKSVTTQVAPAGDTSQRLPDGSLRLGRKETSQSDQQITVEQLVAPRMCNRGARIDDLLEISYLGTVVETGQVFDGSAVKINGQGVPGRGDDVTLFFVLGKQPFGQFPPGWDTGLYGMCVGERRRLVIPPVLAYGSTGVPRRGIPPDATLQYDITLVSLNGLATPQ